MPEGVLSVRRGILRVSGSVLSGRCFECAGGVLIVLEGVLSVFGGVWSVPVGVLRVSREVLSVSVGVLRVPKGLL